MYFVRLSTAGDSLEEVLKNMDKIKDEISLLKDGKYKELQERKDRLQEKKDDKKTEQIQTQNLINEKERRKGSAENEIRQERSK